MEVHIELCGQAVSVEISIEIAEYLDQAKHKEENLTHEKRRHWDKRESDEYIVALESHCCIAGQAGQTHLCPLHTRHQPGQYCACRRGRLQKCT